MLLESAIATASVNMHTCSEVNVDSSPTTLSVPFSMDTRRAVQRQQLCAIPIFANTQASNENVRAATAGHVAGLLEIRKYECLEACADALGLEASFVRKALLDRRGVGGGGEVEVLGAKDWALGRLVVQGWMAAIQMVLGSETEMASEALAKATGSCERGK